MRLKSIQYTFFIYLILSYLLASFSFAQQDTSGLVSAEEAFQIEVDFNQNSQTISVSWDIEKGYYLYKDQIKFLLDNQPISSESYQIEKGIIKDDPLFGLVEIYFDSLSFEINIDEIVKFNQLSAQSNLLTVKYQGCYDPLGICYPPQSQEIEIPQAFHSLLLSKLAAKDVPLLDENLDLANSADVANIYQEAQLEPAFDQGSDDNIEISFSNQSSFFEESGQQNLVNQNFDDSRPIFTFAAYVTDTNSVNINFSIPEDYYLYNDQFDFVSLDKDIGIATIEISQGEQYDDPEFGLVEVQFHQADIKLQLNRHSNTDILPLEVHYQGCKVNSICLPPAKETVSVQLKSNDQTAITRATSNVTPNSVTPSVDNEVDKIDNPAVNQNKSLMLLLIGAFGAGLLLTFTPCVLPMIPILAGILQKSALQNSPPDNTDKPALSNNLKNGMIAIVYVLGTATTYAIIGAVAGASGLQLQAYFQLPAIIISFSVILFLMALSMFGAFNIQLPTSWQTKLSKFTQNPNKGLFSIYLLGILSALIIGACVSPILISTVSLVIQQGSAVIGALALFIMALGMGVVLIAFAFGATFLLPKSGQWMKYINHLMGLMLLSVALYLLSTIKFIPILWLWTFYLLFVSAYLFSLAAKVSAIIVKSLFISCALFVVIWALFSSIGAYLGNRDIISPINISQFNSLNMNNNQNSTTLNTIDQAGIFTKVNSIKQLDEILSSNEKPYVFIDYYADWCKDCLRMEKTTYQNQQVLNLLKTHFIVIKIDVTDSFSEQSKALKQRYNVYGPPASLFLDEYSIVQKEFSFYGYKNSEDFIEVLNQVIK